MRKLTLLVTSLVVFLLTFGCGSWPTEQTVFEVHQYSELTNELTLSEACKALFLIRLELDIIDQKGDMISSIMYGTGFLYDDSVTIFTAKHVLYPELFDSQFGEPIALGGHIKDKRIFIWRTDTEFRTDGKVDVSKALILNKDFKVSKFAKGNYDHEISIIVSGNKIEQRPWPKHRLDHTDVATLTLSKPMTDIKGLAIRAPQDAEKGSMCYLIGFGGGPQAIEINTVNPAVSNSFIRKVESHIELFGVIIPGNSGGPVVDSKGIVIGLASSRRNNVIGYAVKGDDVLSVLK